MELLMLKKMLLVAASVLAAPVLAQVPSQFIAKQYSEALGRAPEPASWQAASDYLRSAGCTQAVLTDFTVSIFNSTEYTSKAYIPEEQVLTAYRAVLGREPDPDGFNYWVSRMKAGVPIADIIRSLAGSPEFAGLKNAICDDPAYGPATYTAPHPIDNKVWTQAQLESCLQANTVCSVPPRTIVRVNSTVTIPAGKTLETAGSPGRRMYARQARIVRHTRALPGTLLLMKAGSTVRNIWVSGGRDNPEFVNTPFPTGGEPIDRVYPNINYVGGNYGVISGVRSDAPLSATHIATYPVPFPTTAPSASSFQGIVTIQDNLTTGYFHKHYETTTPVSWADGISSHVNSAIISNNDIIDPTDVGIVIFGHSNSEQRSTASNNVIVHAGHSAYGSIGLDTTNCNFSSYNTCRFSGTGFTNNTIFGGKKQHSDIMLINGTAGWGETKCSETDNRNCGTGGQMSGNRTILGDNNQIIPVQIAIHVDGMLNAVTSGNALGVNPIDGASIRQGAKQSCFKGSMIVNARPLRASGSLQSGADAYVSGTCVVH
jgi:hypothetical protein